MRCSYSAFLFCLILCASAIAQDGGTVQCDPEMKQVPAWTTPGSSYVIEQLSCGQAISVLDLEKGYFKIQLGNRIGYVNAKYVKLPQTQGQREPQPEEKQIKAAQPQQPTPQISRIEKVSQSKAIKGRSRKRHANVNVEMSHIEYKEPETINLDNLTGIFAKYDGMMWGVSADYAFFPNRFMFKLDGRFSFGDVDYSSPGSSGSGSASGIRDYQYETRFAFGYVYKASENTQLTPFFGIGHRHLSNNSGGMVTDRGAHGYDRRSNYLYSPMGVEGVVRFKNGWSFNATGEYDLFWHGWQYSELGDFDPAFGTILSNQDNGWGARASLSLIKDLGPIDFAFGPYFRYWDIDNSEIGFEFGGLEPANKTKEWGAKIGIRF